MTKHLTLLCHKVTRIFPIFLCIGITWGQNTTSFSPNDDSDSDKLVQSFRSDLEKFYTVTYSGEFLGQKNNKVYFKPINDAPLKLLRLQEVKELKVDNKVLIKNGKWKIEPESIKPYKRTFIDLEEINKIERTITIQTCCVLIVILSLLVYLDFKNNFKMDMGGPLGEGFKG